MFEKGERMQIRNDYQPRQGQAYSQSHSHYITECIHEEESRKRQGGTTGKTTAYQKGDAAKAAVEYVASFSVEGMSANQNKKKTGPIKGFWDSLGDEKAGDNTFDVRQTVLNGIHGAATAIQTFWDKSVVRRATAVKDKAKAMPSQAIRQFGKGKEAFSALLSGGMTFKGGKFKGKHQREKEEIQIKQPENYHLMDSYNKSGNYCQLHENLTYQKPKGNDTAREEIKNKQ